MKDRNHIKIKDVFKLNHYAYKLSVIALTLLYVFLFIISDFSYPGYGYQFFILIFMVIFCLWWILPRYADKIVHLLLVFIYSLYMISQRIYASAFEQYFSFGTLLSLYKEVYEVKSSVMELITPKDYGSLIAFVVFMIMVILLRDDKKLEGKKILRSNLIALAVTLVATGLNLFIFEKRLEQTDMTKLTYSESDRFMFEDIPSTTSFVNKFGIDAFLIRDIGVTFIEPLMDDHEEKAAEIVSFLSENDHSEESNAMTGIYADKNIIMIQCESLMNVAIDPVLTPTLYKLRNEGIWFTEFTAPLLTGSTSDTEILTQMSIHPIVGGETTMNDYGDDTFPVSLPKLFKEAGYSTTAYHNNYAVYYNRNVFYPSNYYDDFFAATDMGLENQTSDLITLDYISWILAEKDQFFSYIISYSGHQPYTMDCITSDEYPESTAEEYQSYVAIVNATYPDLSEEMQVYLAKCMSLDRGVAKLIEALEVYGRLDDTVFVLYGDHYAKGLVTDDATLESDLAILGKDESDMVTPLIIYNSEGPALEVNKYCTTIDILPTIANLFDMSYDTSLIFGYDIFDPDYIGYRFDADGTITSADFTYDYENGLQITGDISEATAQSIVDYYQQMRKISEYIIELDYFAGNDE